jgi:predicted glycosyltransferase
MKIWLDFCEPKSITMLRPLYNRLVNNHSIFITARDFDATYTLLDEWGVPYYKVGTYGGADLLSKLRAYSDRLTELINIVAKEKPDFLFCITSPEAIRVAFGLQLPHIMFNDEPRSYGCSSLTLPFIKIAIVPKPIPLEWYLNYGVPEAKLIRFHGIDEVAWLNRQDFKPNLKYSKELGLIPDQYFVLRTEATQSYAHLKDRLQPHETLLIEILPKLIDLCKKLNRPMRFLIIPRYQEQFDYLAKIFASEITSGVIILKKSVAHLADIMYHAAMVISGGGTMVRESALLGIPSIEFIATDTYPQEQFLMDNGFPLVHVKTTAKIIAAVQKFLTSGAKHTTWDKIDALENPITIGLNEFKKIMKCE